MAGVSHVLTPEQEARFKAGWCACGCYWCSACLVSFMPSDVDWTPAADGSAAEVFCPTCGTTACTARPLPASDPLVPTVHTRTWVSTACRARGFRQRRAAGLVVPANQRARQRLLDQAQDLEAKARAHDQEAAGLSKAAVGFRAQAEELRARAAGQQVLLPGLEVSTKAGVRTPRRAHDGGA